MRAKIELHNMDCMDALCQIACWDLGFDLCGYELDEDYYKAALNRLEEHKRQGQFEFA